MERYDRLAERKKKGEDLAAEIESLKAARPSLADLRNDALRIIDSDPTDAAAFQATGIVMRTNGIDDMKQWAGSANQMLQARMLNVLLAHHLHRSDFLSVVYANFDSNEEPTAFWTKVFDASPWPIVRAAAAYNLTKYYSRWLDETDLSSEKRQELRQHAQHYAGILRDDYADVSPLSREAEKILSALSHSPGATLPSLDVSTVSGGVDKLTNYRGRVVLLDVWASWCGPCRKDHPKLVALKHEMAGKPFEIVSISADESPKLVADYMAKEIRLPWPQWYVGPEGDLLSLWGVSGYPTYLLLDSDGMIQARGLTTDLNAITDHARKLVTQIDPKRSETT